MKILNLYAGIGGNRKLWGDDHEVTAVEYDPKIAKVYEHYFPMDNLVVGDAHQYLLDHHSEYDLVWASPPCPTHSKMNFSFKTRGWVQYPAMELYQEILYLQHFHNGLYVVENVISYYEPLIEPQIRGRHYFWSNFKLQEIKINSEIRVTKSKTPELEQEFGYDLTDFNLPNTRGVLRNCVDPKLGLLILNSALSKSIDYPQDSLFGSW